MLLHQTGSWPSCSLLFSMNFSERAGMAATQGQGADSLFLVHVLCLQPTLLHGPTLAQCQGCSQPSGCGKEVRAYLEGPHLQAAPITSLINPPGTHSPVATSSCKGVWQWQVPLRMAPAHLHCSDSASCKRRDSGCLGATSSSWR